jgi:hypothetical protein
MVELRPHRKKSYKPNHRNTDHTVLCFYHWVCNCSYIVVSVSTIVLLLFLRCGLCFYHWVCNCSYGVVSVSTIGFVAKQRPHVRTVTNPMVEQRLHRKKSYKPNGRNRDHTVRTVTIPMVETECTR